jgi:hypothetical protein
MLVRDHTEHGPDLAIIIAFVEPSLQITMVSFRERFGRWETDDGCRFMAALSPTASGSGRPYPDLETGIISKAALRCLMAIHTSESTGKSSDYWPVRNGTVARSISTTSQSFMRFVTASAVSRQHDACPAYGPCALAPVLDTVSELRYQVDLQL